MAAARSTAEVDMSAFDENMDPSSSSLSSSLKRDRDSPAEVKPVGTKVRILPLRMRVFLLFSMGVLEAFFYRGVIRRALTSSQVKCKRSSHLGILASLLPSLPFSY